MKKQAKRRLASGGEGRKLWPRPDCKRDNSEQTLETLTCNSVMATISCLEEEAPFISIKNSATALHPTQSIRSSPTTMDTTSKGTKRPRHHRSGALVQQDYDDLIVRSRGWVYDSTEVKERSTNGTMILSIKNKQHTHRRDRLRNRALTEDDFDQYIFAPRTLYAF
jgi:hypothetical protein